MTVQLAITPDARWQAEPDELVAAAHAAGFSALGIPGGRASADVAALYRHTGLRCHEVLAFLVGDDEDAAMAAALPLAEAAATMAAEWVLTVFAAPSAGATARAIERAAALFADAGAGMAVEFSPLGPIATIHDGMEVVRIARRGGRAALLIDAWHFSFGASTWAELEALPPEDIAYLQFTDALVPESDRLGRETMHRRALPGEGVLELDRFASTVLGLGYEGLVSAEVLSAELRTLPVAEIVRRIHATTSPYWL